ncbi:phosphoribosylamine--glycine ligase [Allomuricauda sp. SCSIO 65647]|uniref:phosphoribosylamine--glycine ligase n=1 Tax=Allomuricauda sp. SCSIO 65647 TaxID=2908843 RepID=UPI001F428680|nr:phosphoribosylamine--glycine ligase [Muricauda sp. SCSIO 65647]UJH69036.1 phosphoribosylamine--glycine ligase [Muricauda sp. SCSIO 65647]
MNILLLGSGGREHTLAWKISQSNKVKKLFVAPGNAGTSKIANNIDVKVDDFGQIKELVLAENIEMVVVGPEDPLVKGIHDFFLQDAELAQIPVIGPQKLGATLEGSKEFAKTFMKRHNIPTAAYESFTLDSMEEGFLFLESMNPPYVLKADGLAAGKGVLILNDINEAKEELKAMLADAKFGVASQTVVIEEFLNGIELSCFVLTDGEHYKILPMAKDYKRIGEGDTGLNTGGMGAISPVPFVDGAFMQKIEERIVKPTIVGLKKDSIPYVGFIFIGLIKVDGEPKVIEYNVRMGDPETEVVMPRIKNDFVEVLQAVAEKKLGELRLDIDERSAVTVMTVSGGYPEAYEKGKEIFGLDEIYDSLIFHAGTKEENGKVMTNGGRVIAVTSYGNDFREALAVSYKNIEKICFDDIYYRKDIGFDL